MIKKLSFIFLLLPSLYAQEIKFYDIPCMITGDIKFQYTNKKFKELELPREMCNDPQKAMLKDTSIEVAYKIYLKRINSNDEYKDMRVLKEILPIKDIKYKAKSASSDENINVSYNWTNSNKLEIIIGEIGSESRIYFIKNGKNTEIIEMLFVY